MPRTPPILGAAILALLSLFASQAMATERVALLIGNSDYVRADLRLNNPRNDVFALSEALAVEDFEVFETIDQDLAGMRQALARFGDEARGAEMAVVFYAGHGVQMGGENYLVGVDFAGADAEDLKAHSLAMSEIRQRLEASRVGAGLIILDACRNTPFADSGLARPGLVRSRGGAGLMIVYSTDPGNFALDGSGENSVFTEALLDNLGTPGLDVRLMLGRVRQQVVLQTGGLQVPWVEEALLGEHIISTKPPQTVQSDAIAADIGQWRLASRRADARAYRQYLSSYPDGMFADVARERIEISVKDPSGSDDSSQMLLASADHDAVNAALSALGLMAQNGSSPRSATADTAEAFSTYADQFPDPDAASVERLFSDATRTSMFLGAITGQRIRTDIVALRSVDRAQALARVALAELETLAETNPEAKDILLKGRADLAAIEQARATILDRLDQSRSYYQDLLSRTSRFIGSAELGPGLAMARGAGAAAEADAQTKRLEALFIQHASMISDENDGSYFWLEDFDSQG
ncbi:caspase family protein [Aliiruegeria lutimaris]|uniref:caspase family protein n=1 Tax=Aliiruegeria lutimaris TaxID=571298 RepID=UPI00147D69D6|nr:caspase family protein [Aliiruegeria lutimaris]